MPRLARGLPQKQDGIKIVTRIPSNADGKAGDMRLLTSSSIEGSILYIKSGNKWFPFQSGIDTGKKIVIKPDYDSGYVTVVKNVDYTFNHGLNSKILRLEVYLSIGSLVWNITSSHLHEIFDSPTSKDTGFEFLMWTADSILVKVAEHNVFVLHDGTEFDTGALRILAWKTGVVT